MTYRALESYQITKIIYDFTVLPKIYISRPYRTYDQMIQAARLGKQNIVEASAQKTSKKTELKLLGVSHASLQEFLEDFEDFLRQRNFKLWQKDSPKAKAIRALAYKNNRSYKTYPPYLDHPETAANAAICLINQANFLLERQIKSLEEKFIHKGGWTEDLYRQRISLGPIGLIINES